MNVPPIHLSISTAFTSGFERLHKAAVQLSQPLDVAPPTDTVELSAATTDPMIAGVTDLMLAKVQVGAAAMLLRTYNANQMQLLDLLNSSGSDQPSATWA